MQPEPVVDESSFTKRMVDSSKITRAWSSFYFLAEDAKEDAKVWRTLRARHPTPNKLEDL